MNLLEVKNISKTYGTGEATVHALKQATFSVPKGEFVAIVGESGSGKSTLLNMIGALDTPTSGKVFIDGKGYLKSSTTSRSEPAPMNGQRYAAPMKPSSAGSCLPLFRKRWTRLHSRQKTGRYIPGLLIF